MARAAAPMFRGFRGRTNTTTRRSSSVWPGKGSILRQDDSPQALGSAVGTPNQRLQVGFRHHILPRFENVKRMSKDTFKWANQSSNHCKLQRWIYFRELILSLRKFFPRTGQTIYGESRYSAQRCTNSQPSHVR